MNTLTILNHSTFSIRFSIFYENAPTLSTISTSFYGNGKYETIVLPDEVMIFISIQTSFNNIISEIFNDWILNEGNVVYELIGSSKNNFKVFEINMKYINEKYKYIYFSNKISSILSCNISFTILKTKYTCLLPIICKNKFKTFHLPIKSKEITIEFFTNDTNNKLMLIERRFLTDYEELPKCYEINKALFSSTIYIKEIKCSNKFIS